MKMKSILGALCVLFVACLSLPAIAAVPDSPPQAQPATENFNLIESIPTGVQLPGVACLYLRAPAPASCDITILGGKSLDKPFCALYQRRSVTSGPLIVASNTPTSQSHG